ncbi:MAG: C-terminal helicase domain-containing protein, partial [Gemmatimonadales bacterium]
FVTATPIHNRPGDLFHLFRLFLRDHALAALGIPSLRHAALDRCEPQWAAAIVPRLVVARSRARVRVGYAPGALALHFPVLLEAKQIRAAPLSDETAVAEIVALIGQLGAGGPAAPLLRLMLLRRLGSSLAAFRASLSRHEMYVDLALRAAAEGRKLTRREFQRCFPQTPDGDAQLAMWPLLLAPGQTIPTAGDRELIQQIHALLRRADATDPKAEALTTALDADPGKTIVFTDSRVTARYLLRRLSPRRVAALCGDAGRFAAGEARRGEILRAFAPVAQHAAAPPPALETDVLVATDLLSEGLDLQDAQRVVHYDLPWSPARLRQRLGRIDRLGSRHAGIRTVTFLPTGSLSAAIAIEQRLASKTHAQRIAGAERTLDWCDELAEVAAPAPSPAGCWTSIDGDRALVVLIVRIGGLTEAFVVSAGTARADAGSAALVVRQASRADRGATAHGGAAVRQAIASAAPLIRERLDAVQSARWRAADRDRLSRRLIPWVLSAARHAARRGEAGRVRRLDAVVSRLAHGMTAGEELLLEDLLGRREPLVIDAVCDWHEHLPPLATSDQEQRVELVAAIVVAHPASPA